VPIEVKDKNKNNIVLPLSSLNVYPELRILIIIIINTIYSLFYSDFIKQKTSMHFIDRFM